MRYPFFGLGKQTSLSMKCECIHVGLAKCATEYIHCGLSTICPRMQSPLTRECIHSAQETLCPRIHSLHKQHSAPERLTNRNRRTWLYREHPSAMQGPQGTGKRVRMQLIEIEFGSRSDV